MHGRVGSSGGEQGLLGLAFAPDYASSGRFYVDYTNTSGNTVIAEYRRANADRADPSSWRKVLTVKQPFENHNGRWIAFKGSELYIALGDGGSGGDPGNRAQRLNTLLGKILRIDPRDRDGTGPATLQQSRRKRARPQLRLAPRRGAGIATRPAPCATPTARRSPLSSTGTTIRAAITAAWSAGTWRVGPALRCTGATSSATSAAAGSGTFPRGLHTARAQPCRLTAIDTQTAGTAPAGLPAQPRWSPFLDPSPAQHDATTPTWRIRS